jgi:predicted ATP-dependent endonuclease of OLD family
LGQFARSILICIDEPEQHLSSGSQKSYAQFLKKLSNDFQVIVTTHSQHFLSKDKPEANCVLIRDPKNGTAQIRSEFATYEAIRTVLGIDIDDSLYLGNINVVVEGDCELIALRQTLRAGFEQGVHKINPDKVFIIPRCGAIKIPPFVDFVVQLGLPVLVMLDNDREALKAEQDILEQTKGQYIDILKIPLENGREEAEIEDLIPEDILIEVAAEHLEKYRGIHLSKDDFVDAYKHNERIKRKKWNQRLTEVLRFKNALPRGNRIDDLVQKNEIFREAMDRFGVLSKDTVHSFLWDIFPQKIMEMLESFKKKNTVLRYGVIMNTRGFSWTHPANLVDHLDHDF